MLTRKMAVAVLLLAPLLFAAGCATYTPDASRRPEMNEGQAGIALRHWLLDNAGALASADWTGPDDLRTALQLVATGQATGSAGFRTLVVVGPDGQQIYRGWLPVSMVQRKKLMDYLYAVRYWRSAQGKAEEAEAFARFQPGARAWHALPVKPRLPLEAERFRILAENASREKNSAAAAGYYDRGLAAVPLWPQGWYNAALIYSEEQCYAQAGLDMKRYLELCPDAPDADAALQKMHIWEEKAKEAPFRIP